MKSLLIIATGAIAIGLGIMIYRRRSTVARPQNFIKPQPVYHPKKHHLTGAFSNAKKRSLN